MALREVSREDQDPDGPACTIARQYDCDSCEGGGRISIYQGRWHQDDFGMQVKVRCNRAGEDQDCPVLGEAMDEYIAVARKHAKQNV